MYGVRVAALNINQGIMNDTGKLEALLLIASRKQIGIIGHQERHKLRIVERTRHNFWGLKWALHIAGLSNKPRRQRNGFLVSQESSKTTKLILLDSLLQESVDFAPACNFRIVYRKK